MGRKRKQRTCDDRPATPLPGRYVQSGLQGPVMRIGALIGPIILVSILAPVQAFAGPEGVWISADASSTIKRIHISGSPFDYTALIDYRCRTGVCSTFQSLSADSTHLPPTFFVSLEGAGPTSTLALRWQSGPPCNHPKSGENPLAFWARAIRAPSGTTQIGTVGRSWCLVHPPAVQPSPRPPAATRSSGSRPPN